MDVDGRTDGRTRMDGRKALEHFFLRDVRLVSFGLQTFGSILAMLLFAAVCRARSGPPKQHASQCCKNSPILFLKKRPAPAQDWFPFPIKLNYHPTANY